MMDIYKRFYEEIAKAYIDYDADLASIGNQAIVSLERVRLSLSAVCPECESAILPSQYCMMGHWCGSKV
jgi:hypothetical protein